MLPNVPLEVLSKGRPAQAKNRFGGCALMHAKAAAPFREGVVLDGAEEVGTGKVAVWACRCMRADLAVRDVGLA